MHPWLIQFRRISMDDSSKTESIQDLVRSVENETLSLPEFQRDFVWEIGKTIDLFDSLVREIFIGAIIYGVPSFDITIREIDKRPRKQRGKKRARLITTLLTKDEMRLSEK